MICTLWLHGFSLTVLRTSFPAFEQKTQYQRPCSLSTISAWYARVNFSWKRAQAIMTMMNPPSWCRFSIPPGPKTAQTPGWEDSDDRVLQISLPLSQLDDLEAAAFYFLCSYTIKTLKKLCKTCDSCFNMLKLDRSLAPTTEDESLPDLLTYKRDFTGDALIYPSKLASDTLMVCEKVVRNLQRNDKFYLRTVFVERRTLEPIH